MSAAPPPPSAPKMAPKALTARESSVPSSTGPNSEHATSRRRRAPSNPSPPGRTVRLDSTSRCGSSGSMSLCRGRPAPHAEYRLSRASAVSTMDASLSASAAESVLASQNSATTPHSRCRSSVPIGRPPLTASSTRLPRTLNQAGSGSDVLPSQAQRKLERTSGALQGAPAPPTRQPDSLSTPPPSIGIPPSRTSSKTLLKTLIRSAAAELGSLKELRPGASRRRRPTTSA
mmetsp:Transcript_7390/g.26787  ORF Transcript_7390/g.26787 Transcript_7390/m.26787 type:complete len:231 (-) Transcript_7390:1366-2058(-)